MFSLKIFVNITILVINIRLGNLVCRKMIKNGSEIKWREKGFVIRSKCTFKLTFIFRPN